MAITVNQLIQKYVELRDHKSEMVRKQKEQVAQVDKAMGILLSAITEEMDQIGVESIRCEHGTAFKKPSMSVKTSDRVALFEYIHKTGNFDLLTSAVSKEAIREHLERNDNQAPPGVDVVEYKEIQVRRA